MLTRALAVAVLALGVLLGLQTWLRHTEQIAHRDLQVSVERDRQARTVAALKTVNDNTAKQETHATASQENAHELLEELSRQRDAAVAGAARAERLRIDQERRSATYRAMSVAGAAACRDLADRHEALDRNTVEGIELVNQLRATVVARDAEVKTLRTQVDIERALNAQPRRPDGGTTKGKP